jgi:hypothetical protein
MKVSKLVLTGLSVVTLGACSGSGHESAFDLTSDDGGSGGAVGDGHDSGSPLAAPEGGLVLASEGGILVPAPGCPYADGVDHDGDGFAATEGDCNDCDPNSNPGALDVPKDGMDEDCDGVIDDEPAGCDVSATLASVDAFQAAQTIDICRRTTEAAKGKNRIWGVTSALFVAPDGTDNCGGSCATNANFALGHGNLTHLGGNDPQQGTHMLALSSGTARDPTDPGYQNVAGFDKGFTVPYAKGFPLAAPACPGVSTGEPHDGAALALTIRVPTNANSFSFNENFFSYEFPDFVCSTFNDGFTVEMTPAPATLASPNLVFDQSGNPLSVNNAMLQVCDPQTTGAGTGIPPKEFACPLGSSALHGTGFGSDSGTPSEPAKNHAATGWLKTTVNVDASLKGKDITILFAVWDSGDGVLDSTALVDNFTWSTQPGSTTPVTTPVPPK